MFFLKSLRRRLVTGFTVALGLMLVLAAVGILALIQHRRAVSELEYVLHHSPDRDALSQSFSRILGTLTTNHDVRKSHVMDTLRIRFSDAVTESKEQLGLFKDRIEDLKQSPELRSRLPFVLQDISKMEQGLADLKLVSYRLRKPPDSEHWKPAEQLSTVQMQVAVVISRMHLLVDSLPAYRGHRNFAASLQKEQRYSARLQRFVIGVLVTSIGFYAVMVALAFRWISNPVRAISLGVSRIAEGDFDYRIPVVSKWNDELSTLRTNVNLMADRFQDTQNDLNAMVRERSQQLLRSERLAGLGFLAAGVAHEINNPLSAIRLASDAMEYRLLDSLAEEEPDRTEILDRLAMIRRESARCGEITARILDFARGQENTRERKDMTRIVEEVLAMVRPMPACRTRKITFDRSAPLMVQMNPSQIKQVLLNVVANALQATCDGGRIEICIIEQVDWAVVQVQDDGCGMSTDTLSHLFEPFYSTKQAGQGTGLGMSITHRIVEDHHGTIEPSSKGEGQGSQFRIRLPLRQRKLAVA